MPVPSFARRVRAVHLTTAIAVLALALTVTACGSDNKSSSGGGASSATSSGGSSKLKKFEAKIDKDLAAASQKQTVTPPTSGPPAAKGKKVYVIACILAAEGCARESRTAVEAAKAIGWEVKLIDTGSVPAKMAAAVQQAIDAKADGIVVQAIDAKFIAGPLAKAKKAGIKMICFACINQNNLYDSTIPTEEDFFKHGYTLGEAMYKQTNGRPRLIFGYDASFGVTGVRKKGTEQFFKDCQAAGGDCKIVDTENFLVTELTTRVPGLAGAAARKYPDANAMWMSYDSAQPALTQGLRQAGVAASKIGLYGFDGNTNNLEAIRKGNYQVATMAGPFEWIGWAEIDGLNRMFQGEKPVDGVIRMKLMTKDNLPASNTWSGDIDFRPGYKKVWQVQ